jgi:hypothetical protein
MWEKLLMLWTDPSIWELDPLKSSRQDSGYLPDGIFTISRGQTAAVDQILSFGANIHWRSGGHPFATQGQFWKKPQWRGLVSHIRGLFTQEYGPGVDLGIGFRDKHIHSINNAIMAATLSRRLAVGRKFVGLVPRDTKMGDIVFCLSRGETPFVLREPTVLRISTANIPIPGSAPIYVDDKYELIGDWYIEEFMNATDFARNGEWRIISIL